MQCNHAPFSVYLFSRWPSLFDNGWKATLERVAHKHGHPLADEEQRGRLYPLLIISLGLAAKREPTRQRYPVGSAASRHIDGVGGGQAWPNACRCRRSSVLRLDG